MQHQITIQLWERMLHLDALHLPYTQEFLTYLHQILQLIIEKIIRHLELLPGKLIGICAQVAPGKLFGICAQVAGRIHLEYLLFCC